MDVSNFLSNKQLCCEDEKEALTVFGVIIKSKQKIQVIKPSKEPGNNWALELGGGWQIQTIRTEFEAEPNNKKKYHKEKKLTFWNFEVLLFNLLLRCVCNSAFLLLSGHSMQRYHTGLAVCKFTVGDSASAFHSGHCCTTAGSRCAVSWCWS